MKQEPSSFKDFTRGGQITLNALRMFWQVLKLAPVMGLILFLCSFGVFFNQKMKPYDWYLLDQYKDAYVKILWHDNKVKHTVKTPQGIPVKLKAIDFIHSLPMEANLKHCQELSLFALWRASIITGAFFIVYVLYFKWRGKVQRETHLMNGQVKVEPKILAKLLKKKHKASHLSLAGVPLIKNAETQHILLAGTTGTGKSVAMKELMDQVRANHQRAIVYDIDGTFIPDYYRPDHDILLNPLDERTPAWNIWQECWDLADFEAAALSLMPEHLSGTEPFWISAARTLFVCAALKLQLQNRAQTKHLLAPIFSDDLRALNQLVAGTPAARLTLESIEKMAHSIAAVFATYCKSLLYLKEEGEDPLFSIRRWIEAGDKEDSWLFIAANTQKLDALRPLLSVWLDVAAKSILSLNPSLERRLWFFLDELPSLHKLPNLMNALSRGRKYGACFVGAIQDIHQLYAVYGKNDAETLTSLFNTKVFYRTQEPNSGAWMSRLMGEIETLEKKEGFSYGAHEMRDGVSIHQERRRDPVVKASDFLELEDLNAFLRLPGSWPVTQLSFELQDRKALQIPFLARDLQGLLFKETNNKENSEAEENPFPSNAGMTAEAALTPSKKGLKKVIPPKTPVQIREL